MREGDGLSRKDRWERVTSITPFHIIENDMDALLRQVKTISSYIRYYDFNRLPNGYWDELLLQLDEIRKVCEITGKLPEPDGKMEPAQAVILIFLRQLQGLTDHFNQRWKQMPLWFMNEILQIKSLEPFPNRVWVRFTKNTTAPVSMTEGEPFRTHTVENEAAFTYKLTEDYVIQNVHIEQAFSVYFEKQKRMFPASALNAVTSLKIKDLLHDECGMGLMFDEERNIGHAQSPGFMVASPSLLLREGTRIVTLTFESENYPLTGFISGNMDNHMGEFDFTSEESKYARLIENIFYLQISTVEGWKKISRYTTRSAEECKDDLILKFILPENFPATCACNDELHAFKSDYPILKVLLNLDAWLFPYSWIKDFILRRIRIHTCVEGVTNLLVYNELGRIDNSKPFQPFGLNTERGTWFAVGNYEMAIRPSKSMNVRLQWGQLPDDEYGMKGYYEGYESDIDNASFLIQPRYLTDYAWRPCLVGRLYPLFATRSDRPGDMPAPDLPLCAETQWKNIPLDKMTTVYMEEDLYEYSIRSKTGFVSFMLDQPSIGFGEKRYRYLFANRMLRQTWKKKELPLLNIPAVPVIERITIDYEAEEIIDLRTFSKSEKNRFYHVFPLGCKQVFPDRENTAVPLIYRMESDANIMFGLRNVKGGESIRLYLDFIPVNKEIVESDLPRLKWYYGDGYNWKPMPDSVIGKDTTRNMLKGGCVEFYMPSDTDGFLSRQTGLIWLRAGIIEHHDCIPDLAGIYTNAAELILEIDDPASERWGRFQNKEKELYPVRNIPGIAEVVRISPYYGGREKETDENKLIRISEYITHRGRAVTARDYERITLNRFTAVDKVKCLPSMDTKQGRNGVVTVVVIPRKDRMSPLGWRPKASSNLILQIEEYLAKLVSERVSYVDVINPEYEELMIRCRITFKRRYPIATCRSRLKQLCDRLIAPWQENRQTPSFDYFIRLQTLYERIRNEEYIRSVEELSIIRLAEKKEEMYEIHEYNGTDEIIRPSVPYAIFVPAREHLFLTETEHPFGISEMTIDETFVIE